MKYYCLHHSPAKERKAYLDIFFDKQRLNVEWIEDFLPTSFDVINHPKVNCVHAAKQNVLNDAEVSLCLKHNLAIEKICKINDYGIIFEDDIKQPSWNIKEYLPKMIDEFEKINGEILWIGSDPYFDNMVINLNDPNKISIVTNQYTKSRFAHCYMIHSTVANKVIDYYKNIQAPPDWQWNYTIDYFHLKSCWIYPVIYQRTANKEIPSLLR